LVILNLEELILYPGPCPRLPGPCPWYSLFLCWKRTLISQPTNREDVLQARCPDCQQTTCICSSVLYGTSQVNSDRLQSVQELLLLVVTEEPLTTGSVSLDLYWLHYLQLCLLTWQTLLTMLLPHLCELIAHCLTSWSLYSSSTYFLARL